MCIIIAKRAGANFDMDELKDATEKASIHNSHGAGFSLKKEGSNNILLSKGYWYHELLLDRLEELEIEKGDELMIHMRYATSGNVDTANCHPYVVAEHIDDILIDEAILTDNAVVSHNGTFHMYSDKDSDYSDTVNYIEQYLSADGILDAMRAIEQADYFQMYKLMTGNRLCIMHPDKNKDMDTFGYWNKRKDDSFVYSNYYHIQPHNGYKLETTNREKVQ